MRKNGLDLRVLSSLVALVMVAGGLAVVAIGGQSGEKSRREQALAQHFDAAAVLDPPKAAPPLALRNYLGKPVNIDSYRGKVVLVTFLYTTCPDICPLITSDLHAALEEMGPAKAAKVQIIAVSVDPKADTPKSVAAFLARHEMTGRMQYLIGTPRELARVWKAWGVGSQQDVEKPQFVNHTSVVYGVTASGKRLTLYNAEFEPSEIVHDVPMLAAL
jgi:protein SCO1/2